MPSWDDPKLREKPERKKKRPIFVHDDKKGGLTCDNCGSPFSLVADPHCRCGIWEVGRRG